MEGLPLTLDDLIKLINSVGFPIFVAVYLLIWMRQALNKLTDAISKLCITIDAKQQNGGN